MLRHALAMKALRNGGVEGSGLCHLAAANAEDDAIQMHLLAATAAATADVPVSSSAVRYAIANAKTSNQCAIRTAGSHTVISS